MMDERSKRRPSFSEGAKILMADGQEWSLAKPSSEMLGSAQFKAFTRGLLEAEDRSDLLRAEFALAINLLTSNYDLGPNDLQSLLGFRRGSPELAQFQADIHRVSVAVCDEAAEARRVEPSGG